jgi:hypothetical protein
MLLSQALELRFRHLLQGQGFIQPGRNLGNVQLRKHLRLKLLEEQLLTVILVQFIGIQRGVGVEYGQTMERVSVQVTLCSAITFGLRADWVSHRSP